MNTDTYAFFFEENDNIIKKIFKDIKYKSGRFRLDKNNTTQFIEGQCSKIRRQAAKDLIDSTIYLSLNDIFKLIEERVDMLDQQLKLEENRENIAMIVGKKTGSSYFISHIALHFIRKKYPHLIPKIYLNLLNNQHIQDYTIVLFDDISYSGSQISQFLNSIYYHYHTTTQKAIRNGNQDIQKVANIYVCLLRATKFAYYNLTHVPISVINLRSGGILYNEYVESPFKIICGELLKSFYETIGIQRTLCLYIFFAPLLLGQLRPVVSLYSDIKIADSLSTFKFALQYGPIIPSDYIKKYYDYFSNIQIILSENDLSVLRNIDELDEFKNLDDRDRKIRKRICAELGTLIKDLHKNEKMDKDVKTPQYFPLISNCKVKLKKNLKKYDKIFNNYFLSTIPDNWESKDSGFDSDIFQTDNDEDGFLSLLKNEGIDIVDYRKFTKSISDSMHMCPVPIYKTVKYNKTKKSPSPLKNRKVESSYKKYMNKKSVKNARV